METLTQCPLCGENGPFGIYIQCRDYLVSQDVFNVESCSSCGLLFTNPRPTAIEMSGYYQSDEYISHAETVSSLQDKVYMGVKKRMLKQKLKLLTKHLNQQFLSRPPRGSDSNFSEHKRNIPFNNHSQYQLLDFGCGTGAFVKEAIEQGITSVGFEPDFAAREVAAKNGLKVIGAESELDKIGDNSFHAITLWHVIEHLHEFKEKLDFFYRMLKPGGVLFLAAPMANSSDAAMYGKYWAAWDLPRHILHFTPATLTRAGKEAGFEFKEKKPLPFDAWYISLISEQHKKRENLLENRCGGHTIISILKALAKGSWSNLKALTGVAPWSSQTFVFSKPA